MEAAARGSQSQPDNDSDPAERLIVALDAPSADAALRVVDQLQGTCRWFKVGMELYYAAGNSIIRDLIERDLKVFLDLKLHDIPNTVAGAIRSVAGAGASLLTLHASGGAEMMRAAVLAALSPDAPELLAVTVLTSMDAEQLAAIGVTEDRSVPGQLLFVESQVLRLARLARASGITGLVCSAEEVAAVREIMGPGARLVVPGIRLTADVPTGTLDDQRRIATPGQAIARGASMLVVGRPITQAADPGAAAARILGEIASAN